MNRILFSLAFLLLSAPGAAIAQLLPIVADVSGNSATIRVGNALAPLADVRLDFDAPTGLSLASLGLSADSVVVTAPALLARLPSTQVTIPASLPLLLTVEPPVLGGLAFNRQVHVEVHTTMLAYGYGSRYRLFKAPLNGPFRDVTESVLPGSVRTRGTTGGFSQFLVVQDLRSTDTIIAEKIEWLRGQVALLPSTESTSLYKSLTTIEKAVASRNYSAAMREIDSMRARVKSRAGNQIPQTWSANGTTSNIAGELLAGLGTLAFSINFRRDFGP